MGKRQVFWFIENLFFAGLVYLAIVHENAWAELGVAFFVGLLVVSITLMLIGSKAAEFLWQRGQLEYFWGPIDKYRIKGPSAPIKLILIVETIWAALFATVGWYWLTAGQVYLMIFLLYVFDPAQIIETRKRLEERFEEVDKKLEEDNGDA